MSIGSLATIPPPSTSVPARPLPPAACDAHSHVFGPFDRFPPLGRSVYALPEAGPRIHAAFRKTIGVARAVLTQPAPYGNNPAAMLAAIAEAPDVLRAVAVADESIDDVTLEHWRTSGIVGLRFTEMRLPSGERYPGSVGFDVLRAMAPRMRQLGMHAQLWAKASDLEEQLPALLRLGVRVVLDHMGCPDPEEGPQGRAFGRILDLLADGSLWLKLTLCRVAANPWERTNIRAMHDRLVERRSNRLLWGSDWPYVRMHPAPDAGRLADLFQIWIDDADLVRRILVTNPSELYGYEEQKACED